MNKTNNSQQKCCFQGCQTMGEPNGKCDFFTCEPCLESLEAEIRRVAGDRADELFANIDLLMEIEDQKLNKGNATNN